jgi:ribose-phosphate pyrophosphokinase
MDGMLKLFAGNANRPLAEAIAEYLGRPLGKALIGRFANGEVRVHIDENVRGNDVFVIQPTCHPVNENLMELLVTIDALKRASAARVTAVVPYYGYAKQEKKTTGREPITAKLVADLITVAGANRLLTMDLHSPAIEGFFNIPVDHLRAANVLAARVRAMRLDRNTVVVSPDAGGTRRANEFRQRIGASLAMILKQRPGPDVAETVEMVGDVCGKTAILVDDMVITGGTLVEAAEMVLERGAKEVYACVTHAAFTPEGLALLEHSPIRQCIVTDTVPVEPGAAGGKIVVASVAPLLAEAIIRIHENRSVSELFT